MLRPDTLRTTKPVRHDHRNHIGDALMPGTIRMMNAQGDALPVRTAWTTSVTRGSRSEQERHNGPGKCCTPPHKARGVPLIVRSEPEKVDNGYAAPRNHHKSGEQPAPVGTADRGSTWFRDAASARARQLSVRRRRWRGRAVDIAFATACRPRRCSGTGAPFRLKAARRCPRRRRSCLAMRDRDSMTWPAL